MMNDMKNNNTRFASYGGIIALASLCLCLALCTGCSTVSATSSSPPNVQKVGQFTFAELKAELESIPELGQMTMFQQALEESDNVGVYSTYRPEDYAAVQRWLRPKLTKWSEGWLCVQYAQAMRLAMSFTAAKDEWMLRASDRKPPAIGWFGVRQIHSWGGVAGGSTVRHALNIYVAGPRRGMSLWVMEPQSGYRVRVAWQDGNAEWQFDPSAYPNWKYIEFVRLEL